MIRIILVILSCASVVSGCHEVKTLPAPTVVITGCEHFRKISASRSDTEQTRKEILAHNTEYLKVCGQKAQ